MNEWTPLRIGERKAFFFLSLLPSFFLSLFHLYPFPEMVPSSGRIISSTVSQTSFLKTKKAGSPLQRQLQAPPASSCSGDAEWGGAGPGQPRRRQKEAGPHLAPPTRLPAPLHPSVRRPQRAPPAPQPPFSLQPSLSCRQFSCLVQFFLSWSNPFPLPSLIERLFYLPKSPRGKRPAWSSNHLSSLTLWMPRLPRSSGIRPSNFSVSPL